jgi:hypothetical protein
MELKVNKRYLIDSLQTSPTSRIYGLMCVRCLEATGTSYKIEYENGNTIWIGKDFEISIVEELQQEQSNASNTLLLECKVKYLNNYKYQISWTIGK